MSLLSKLNCSSVALLCRLTSRASIVVYHGTAYSGIGFSDVPMNSAVPSKSKRLTIETENECTLSLAVCSVVSNALNYMGL